jgi:hypothetical protein
LRFSRYLTAIFIQKRDCFYSEKIDGIEKGMLENLGTTNGQRAEIVAGTYLRPSFVKNTLEQKLKNKRDP